MKILSVLLVTILSGCAAFRGYEQPIVKPELVSVNLPKKLLVSMKWKAVPERRFSPSSMLTAENKQSTFFYEELMRSGCCELSTVGQDPDLVISGEIDVSYKADGFLEGLLRTPTQFSFAIIPGWDNYHYKLTVKVENVKGQSREYSAVDSGLFIQWLPLAPVALFVDSPGEIDKALLQNLHRNLIYRMKKDGFFGG
jgi:hypothetical protein